MPRGTWGDAARAKAIKVRLANKALRDAERPPQMRFLFPKDLVWKIREIATKEHMTVGKLMAKWVKDYEDAR